MKAGSGQGPKSSSQKSETRSDCSASSGPVLSPPTEVLRKSEPESLYTSPDFVSNVISAMTNLGDHFSTTCPDKLQRIDVQKVMLACNHLSRQCNKSLEEFDAFHMPPPKVPATTAAKRIQTKTPPAHPWISETKRPRLARKDSEDNPSLAEEHSWYCNLCDFKVSVTVREQLYHKRHKHIQSCHKDEAYKVQSVATSLPIIEASDSPALTKAWTCATCNKGLPYMEMFQLDKSIQHHLKSCSGMTRAENTKILKQRPDWGLNHRNEAGWHNADWRQARILEAKDKGHNLQFFAVQEAVVQTRKDCQKLRFTCPNCKRLSQHSTDFVRKPCEVNTFPLPRCWFHLRITQPESVARLVKCWGWGQKQVQEIDDKALRPSSRRKVSRQALPSATTLDWFPDLTEHGDVEPHPGPRGRTLRKLNDIAVLSLNTQGQHHAWKCLNDLGSSSRFHVIVFQELSMSERQQNVFALAANKKGWVCFFTLGYPSARKGSDSRVGGVCTLVKKGLPCSSWRPQLANGGQALAVQLGSTSIINCYTSPDWHTRQPFLQSLFELIQANHSKNLILVGDFNETKAESKFVQTLQSQGWCHWMPMDGLGSRWAQNIPRTFDYVLSKFDLIFDVKARAERWSDHRAFEFRMSHKFQWLPEYTMVDCNTYLPKNPADLSTWTDHLQQEWSRQESEWTAFSQTVTEEMNDLPSDPQSKIDQVWHKVCRFLEEFLLQAARTSPVDMKTTKKPHRKKDATPRFRRVPPVWHQRYDQHSPNQVRHLRKLLGRLHEVEFRTRHGQDIAEDDPLWRKIRKSPWWHEGVSVDNLEAQVEHMDAASKNDNLNAWRSKMRSGPREVFKWLRTKPQNVTNDLINGIADPDDPPARGPQEALDKIYSFWDNVWSRPVLPAELSPEDYVSQYELESRPAMEFGGLSIYALLNAVRAQRAKAGSPDGWGGSELAALPYNMWQSLHTIFHKLEEAPTLPSSWSWVRQTHLCKPKPVTGHRCVSSLRPIAILSVFWRIFIQAKMSDSNLGLWYGSVLQDSQYGCRKQRDCVQALVPLGVAHSQNQYVASLDLKQAFDRVRPSRAVFMLKHYGFDRRLAKQVEHVWTSQRRFLHFAGNYKQTAADVSQSLPQGCPLSPWA